LVTAFEFATATRIVFGPGTLKQAAPLASQMGKRTLLVIGRDSSRASLLLKRLEEVGVRSALFRVEGEPAVETIANGVDFARQQQCDLVISFGGGSAIDAGKSIAALITNTEPILDYVEVIGKAKPLTKTPVPFIAIPTTAGTGAEVTRNAVLFSPEHRVKVSLRSRLLLPRVAIVDPELTYELPAAITASTGMDALTQVIEPFVCVRANAITDGICREGMRRAARSLRQAYETPADKAAREDMALASLCGGLALANAGLGAVHGFAAPIGGMFDSPHGALCAALLPEVMEANLRALEHRAPESPVLERFREVAAILTGLTDASASASIAWLRKLRTDLRIPPLGAYGVRREHIRELCEKASVASSMKANPITLEPKELKLILESAL
jgi:alcohol dehydrogenase class IV